ncbi:MAG: manganese efflux pump [Firmicutes bacterium]|jgi:putative Mn2+ efflux pump MntP|nr:manganese efflux pump [Bacillota bacterium]
MGTGALLIMAVGLAMDAFAVSLCKGLTLRRYQLRYSVLTGLWFGGFQALMPVIGYLLGARFQSVIANVDHWIAFVLLVLIGANMIREAFGEDEEADPSFAFRAMLPMAVATSIDALAVGVTFAFLQVSIVLAAAIIGVVTFLIAGAGVKIGQVFGTKFRAGAEAFGGIVLILLGIKILLEHLGILVL